MDYTVVKRRFNGIAFFSQYGILVEGCKICGVPTRRMYGVNTRLPITLHFNACSDQHAQEYVHRNRKYFASLGSRWREFIFKITRQKKWR